MWTDAIFGPVANLGAEWLNMYSNWVGARSPCRSRSAPAWSPP